MSIFKILRHTPPDTTDKTRAIVEDRKHIANLKHQSVERMKILEISKDLPLLDFSVVTDSGYTLYNNLKVKDLTTLSLESEGITILKVISDKEITLNVHSHDIQAQLITVQKGTIVDLKSNIAFAKGQSFFVPPKEPHFIRYSEDSAAIIYYCPKLKEIRDESK